MEVPKLFIDVHEGDSTFIGFELREDEVLVFGSLEKNIRLDFNKLQKIRDWADLVLRMVEYKKQHGE
jgi:hypothetical protein